MRIKLKPLDEIIEVNPPPWYANAVFQEIEFEVYQSSMKRDGNSYWRLKKSYHNYAVISKHFNVLSNRMKSRVRQKQLNQVYIPTGSAVITVQNNERFLFLLAKKEQDCI